MTDFQQFLMSFMEFTNIWPFYIREWVGGMQKWVEWWQRLNKKQDDTNSRV